MTEDPELQNESLSHASISALQLAKSLIPSVGSRNGPSLEVFLLWPPDLFAFSSLILSITGAYHMVVSPPRLTNGVGLIWPPKRGEWWKGLDDRRSGSEEGEEWGEGVRRVGRLWRRNLARITYKEFQQIHKIKDREFVRRHVGSTENITNGGRRRIRWEPSRKCWVPEEMGSCWQRLVQAMEPEWKGNVFDLLCHERRADDEERRRNWDAFQALVSLHAICDEACVGWGTRSHISEDESEIDKEGNWRRRKDDRDGDTDSSRKAAKNVAQDYAEDMLDADMLGVEGLGMGTLATIHPSRCRVLPKRHTPRVGITLRSLSANLAFHRSSVDVKWRVCRSRRRADVNQLGTKADANRLTQRMGFGRGIDEDTKVISMLLLPWPLKISALDFKTISPDHLTSPDGFGFFGYWPDEEDVEFEKRLIHAISEAEKETKNVDIIVLPESALTEEQVESLEWVLRHRPNVSAYIAGVRVRPNGAPASNGRDGGAASPESPARSRFLRNMVYFKTGMIEENELTFDRWRSEPVGPSPGAEANADSHEAPGSHAGVRAKARDDEAQDKHHRWKLNEQQLKRYNLGQVLSPAREWWEAIKIRTRKVTFVNIGEEMTICALICEDLARQDPIADLIRTAGPNLVVTILMDGPQRRDRWSAKYASVLAEDPGSAVVTLTSIGMVERWRVPNGGPCRSVALWSDGGGWSEEIELEEGCIGVLLTISLDAQAEPTIDGRKEHHSTNTIRLVGVHQIRAQSAQS